MQNNLAERIKELKALRNKAVLENRREVYNELSERKVKIATELKQKDDVMYKDNEEVESGIDVSLNKEMDPSIKDLEYTAEETAEWIKLHGKHQSSNNDDTGLHNFKILAAKTYDKNVKELQRSGLKGKDEYMKEKKIYSDLKAQGLSEAEIRSKLTSIEGVENFVQKIEKWERKVYQKRGRIEKEGIDSAIHEKNRQFNQKLKRHLSQVEKKTS